MSILQKIRNGKKNHKIVNFPGTEEKVAMVILSSNVTTDCMLKTEKYSQEKNITDPIYKDIVLQQYLVYEFLRDKDNLDIKVSDSIDDVRELDVSELAYLVTEYNQLSTENSPFLSAVSAEEFELLKKTLQEIQLSDLSGESLVTLKSFLMKLA